ncbi:hypothetical protein OAK85_00425 [Mariniblastus sp.]|nr:hypothetical protein [Mariniblastus sp.]MDC0283791.1 hypothetical protein [Mariniblastus sp.]
MAPTLRFLLHLTEKETTNEVTGKKVTNAAWRRVLDRDNSFRIFHLSICERDFGNTHPDTTNSDNHRPSKKKITYQFIYLHRYKSKEGD